MNSIPVLKSVCFLSDMELYYEICMLQTWDRYPNQPKKLWICYCKWSSTQNGRVRHRGCRNICPSCRRRFRIFHEYLVPSMSLYSLACNFCVCLISLKIYFAERGKLADPFYRLEHQEEDLQKKKEAEPLLVRLQRVSDSRHADDYALNKALRARLRVCFSFSLFPLFFLLLC